MRSYHNEVKRDLLKKGAGHLLDVGSGFGGDITKWDHYKSVTCVDPSYSNIKELKKRLGTNKKKHHLLLLQALIIMDTRHKILTLTPMLLSRAPKKVYSSPAQESHKYFSQKVEEIDTSEVFTYTPEKVLSKEKIKFNLYSHPLRSQILISFLDRSVISSSYMCPIAIILLSTSANMSLVFKSTYTSSICSIARSFISADFMTNKVLIPCTLELEG
uniref:Uncharacterized protein n=1 Tax=Physcomitrium patens TaxID=3218 RepID=A0A7I4FVK4_PHYPA